MREVPFKIKQVQAKNLDFLKKVKPDIRKCLKGT